MDSLQVTSIHAESTTSNTTTSNCKPRDNENDDDNETATAIILTADRTGNNGNCCRNETAINPTPTPFSDEENEERPDDDEDEEEYGANGDDDDEDMDRHSTMTMATQHNKQMAQHGYGLHLEVDGMSATAATTRPSLRTTRRTGKVEFVRFDSKETVYLTEPNEEHDGANINNHHQNEMVRNKIKEEIKRWVWLTKVYT